MEIRFYTTLPVYAVDIRETVFVKEQGFSRELEFDNMEQRACHAVGFIDGKSGATARFYFDECKNSYLIGRIAVRKEFRKTGAGRKIVTACEEEIKAKGGKSIVIHAQLQAKGFYEALGYTPIGEIDLEENVAHQWMKKTF